MGDHRTSPVKAGRSSNDPIMIVQFLRAGRSLGDPVYSPGTFGMLSMSEARNGPLAIDKEGVAGRLRSIGRMTRLPWRPFADIGCQSVSGFLLWSAKRQTGA